MSVHIKETTDTSFLSFVEDGLNTHNAAATGMPRIPVHIVLEEDGAPRGGIKAHRVGRHFFISWLFVDESLRGRGYGQQLMLAAETAARKAGCTAIFVDTMAFQAPDFYPALGYGICARIPQFYEGHDRIFFKKSLAV